MRILVIEDEHKIAQSIKKGLEQENFAVDLAFDGTSGYDLAISEDYDLIILDLMLPGKDGMQICQQLREKNIHIPILILTARDQVQEKVEGLNSGADDYLVKPFAFEELLARMRSLLRRPRDLQSQILQIEDLSLNTLIYQVKRGGQEIKLTTKEYALLEYLIRHPNQVVTKEQIINHVWDYDADILPNTVEVYIGYLRNKIDKPFFKKSALINTIRGFGYQLGKGV